MQANPLPGYQLGNTSRRDKERYPFNWMTCNGSEMYFCNFANSAEGLTFQGEYRNVKNVIDELNQKYQKENATMTLDVHLQVLAKHWLPLVNGFERSWGKEMVPGDVRRAKNDVESNLQIPRTNWPHQLELN